MFTQNIQTMLKKLSSVLFIFTILLLTGVSLEDSRILGTAQPDNDYRIFSADPLYSRLASYPSDPTSDIDWSGGTSGVTDIQTAFNNARTFENSQLGKNIPMLSNMPSQTTWNSMTDGEKALWLINRERIDRGVLPLEDVETNVTSVAQYYADYLLTNNKWGHYEDGNSPWERMANNPKI